MKLSILQENLAWGLDVVGRAVNTRSTTLPILGNVLLETDNGRLRLTATDLEVSIHCWVGANVEDCGGITVPARTFSDLVNALPKERVDLALDTKTLALGIAAGRTKANIKGVAKQEFPFISTAEGMSGIPIQAEALRKAIQQVTFAAATDKSRPVLTGVLMKFNGSSLTLAAADGYRLSVRSNALPKPVSEPFKVIVPARALNKLNRISGEQSEPIKITVSSDHNRIIFQLTNIMLVSQLIAGNFPDYEQIIPEFTKTKITADTKELLKVCKTAQVFAREASNIVKLRVVPKTGKLTVTATSAESGDNASVLSIEGEGENIEIAFNVEYMINVLRAIETSKASLELTNSKLPGTFRSVDGSDFTYVIMPMQLGR